MDFFGKAKKLSDEFKEAKNSKRMGTAIHNRVMAAGEAQAPGSMEDFQQMILAKRVNAFGKFLVYSEEKYKRGTRERDQYETKEHEAEQKREKIILQPSK